MAYSLVFNVETIEYFLKGYASDFFCKTKFQNDIINCGCAEF